MVLPELTEEIAKNALHAFFREKPFVFIGTGLSCAVDERFGMVALANELVRDGLEILRAGASREQWRRVVDALERGSGLEESLASVTDRDLIREITRVTGDFIARIDREQSTRISSGSIVWPGTKFTQRLMRTLTETDSALHVLTPNYDTLFEHACDVAGIPYSTGFVGGIARQLNWDATERSMYVPRNVISRSRRRTVYKSQKHIRLYKVHGSLNLFFHCNTVVENNAWMWDPPSGSQRVIVTPGLSKFETLQNYRQELLQRADLAIDNASQFLFLGYGFNDSHLEAYIRRKLVNQSSKGVIITKESNQRIDSLLTESPNLWLVCGMEIGGASGTRIHNSRFAESLEMPGKRLWDIELFSQELFGD